MRLNIFYAKFRIAAIMTTTVAAAAVLWLGCAGSRQAVDEAETSAIETVTIGGKVWMKRNLNVEVDGSRCYYDDPVSEIYGLRRYNDDPAGCEMYGRLYTWDAAMKACAELGRGCRPSPQIFADDGLPAATLA